MATQMQKVISNYKQCTQYEGTHAKAPLWPIIVTVPLELLHIDFTSINYITISITDLFDIAS